METLSAPGGQGRNEKGAALGAPFASIRKTTLR